MGFSAASKALLRKSKGVASGIKSFVKRKWDENQALHKQWHDDYYNTEDKGSYSESIFSVKKRNKKN